MSIYMTPMPQPVEQAYAGGDALNVRRLYEFCNATSVNFSRLEAELHTTNLRAAELSALNAKLIQFMNWLAVTNPQILDEFQTTALAFDKLSPRDDGDQAEAYAATSDLRTM